MNDHPWMYRSSYLKTHLWREMGCDLCEAPNREMMYTSYSSDKGKLKILHACEKCYSLADKAFTMAVRLYLATKEA